MADIRIKDLTTLASASLTGDVFVIDGTTGTRKLSAFSPTFGGNATVTGTLTANTSVNSPQLVISDNSLGLTGGAGFYKKEADTVALGVMTSNTLRAWIRTTDARWFYQSGTPVTIQDTTASTTTSTGALVVGNGTSGGLGVGGAIVAGGTITSTASTDSGLLQLNLVNSSTGTSASSLFRFNAGTRTATLQAYNDTHATLAGQLRVGTSNGDIVLVPSGVASATFGASSTTFGSTVNVSVGNGTAATLGLNQTGVANAYLTQKATSGDLALGNGGGDQLTIAKTTGNITIASTTNASSSSFAALVVSGGVGVAKRIVSGEGLTTNGDNETQITFTRNGTISIGPTSAATPKLAVGGGLQLSNTSQSIPAWGDVGAQLSIAGAVITDTTSSGTVSRFVSNSISASSIAASSPTTYTQAASLFIAAGPTANTNVTISNSYALFIAGGRINFGGLPTSSAGLQAGTLWNDGGTLKVA